MNCVQGASGVGLAASQLAKALWKGTKVIVTAGSEEKISICKKNGADFGINYKTEDFAAPVLNFTDNKGACQPGELQRAFRPSQ